LKYSPGTRAESISNWGRGEVCVSLSHLSICFYAVEQHVSHGAASQLTFQNQWERMGRGSTVWLLRTTKPWF